MLFPNLSFLPFSVFLSVLTPCQRNNGKCRALPGTNEGKMSPQQASIHKKYSPTPRLIFFPFLSSPLFTTTLVGFHKIWKKKQTKNLHPPTRATVAPENQPPPFPGAIQIHSALVFSLGRRRSLSFPPRFISGFS